MSNFEKVSEVYRLKFVTSMFYPELVRKGDKSWVGGPFSEQNRLKAWKGRFLDVNCIYTLLSQCSKHKLECNFIMNLYLSTRTVEDLDPIIPHTTIA